MNQLLEHMMKNQVKFHRYALRLTRNEQQAQDVIQRTYLFLLENPKTDIEHPDSFLYLAVMGRFLNQTKMDRIYRKYIQSFTSEFSDRVDPEQENILDKKIQLNKVLDIIDSVCSNKERQAVYHILATDDQLVGINGGSFETLKCNRKWAIKRVRKYLDENSTNS